MGSPPWHPAPPEIKDACRRAAEHCRGRGADIAFLGMQFCLSQECIPSTITGTAKCDELAVNLRAMTEPMDPTLRAEVEAILDPVKDRIWPSGNWHLV